MKNTHIRDEQSKVNSFTSAGEFVNFALKDLLENEHLMSNYSKVT